MIVLTRSILQVVDLRLKDVAGRLRDRRIVLDVDDGARNVLAKQGYSQVYGAWAIARVVRTDVLFPLAQKLLKGTMRSVSKFDHSIVYLNVCIRDGDIVSIRTCEDRRVRRSAVPIPNVLPMKSQVLMSMAPTASTKLPEPHLTLIAPPTFVPRMRTMLRSTHRKDPPTFKNIVKKLKFIFASTKDKI